MTAKLRCAVYTRKSSEEGLEQSFNSLDAQREAAEAYIKSQASEGWRILPTRYDDGGYSGGSMQRPALQQLLADINAGGVDVVVVYKIDRLTRSLADFARIVERFDARAVSFVSVTQAFNTTSSMGRLTLNVLLSFAQFERELTGERIRDKIAASKAKGMWMGGAPPLGYDLPLPGSRTLQLNAAEAAQVRHIFARYLELGSVHRLRDELVQQGILSKRRTTRSGRRVGGVAVNRGALFHLLRNRIYLGQIPHKGVSYPGEHPAIVDAELFEAVQHMLHQNQRRHAASGKVATAILTGRIVDAADQPMSPAFSYGRSGRVYRYYVSAPLQQGATRRDDTILRRIAVPTIEAMVTDIVQRLLLHVAEPLTALQRVQVTRTQLILTLSAKAGMLARPYLRDDESLVRGEGDTALIAIPVHLPLRGGPHSISAGSPDGIRLDPVLITALRKAHALLQHANGVPSLAAAPASSYERRLLRLAFLAPDLQRDILAGRQPANITVQHLLRADIPLAWARQRAALGWGHGLQPVLAGKPPVPLE